MLFIAFVKKKVKKFKIKFKKSKKVKNISI
jgi:hypothetical protein